MCEYLSCHCAVVGLVWMVRMLRILRTLEILGLLGRFGILILLVLPFISVPGKKALESVWCGYVRVCLETV